MFYVVQYTLNSETESYGCKLSFRNMHKHKHNQPQPLSILHFTHSELPLVDVVWLERTICRVYVYQAKRYAINIIQHMTMMYIHKNCILNINANSLIN